MVDRLKPLGELSVLLLENEETYDVPLTFLATDTYVNLYLKVIPLFTFNTYSGDQDVASIKVGLDETYLSKKTRLEDLSVLNLDSYERRVPISSILTVSSSAPREVCLLTNSTLRGASSIKITKMNGGCSLLQNIPYTVQLIFRSYVVELEN